MKNIISYLLALMVILSFTRCQEDPAIDIQSNNAAEEPVSLQEINGSLLAEVPVSEDYTISFWEFEPGVIGINESQSVDMKNPPKVTLDDIVTEGVSLVSIYKQLIGDRIDSDILSALNKADARREIVELQRKDTQDVPPAGIAPANGGIVKDSKSLSACSGDYYNDNYGEDWFLDRYCIEGGFRWCPTNVTWVWSGYRQTTWFKTCGMAADFDIGARFKGQHWTNGAWKTDWDYTLRARWVNCWWYSGTGYRQAWIWGDDPCPRVHMSVLDNR